MPVNRTLMLAALAAVLLLIVAGCTPAQPQDVDATPEETAPAATDAITAEPQDVATSTPAPVATEPPTAAPPATQAGEYAVMYLVAIGTAGPEGEEFGCGDSLVAVQTDEELDDDDALEDALEELLDLDDEFFGESGLYNALYQSDLDVEGIQLEDDGTAIIALEGEILLGGTCDTPRAQAQLEQTALQFDEVQRVEFLLNGEPLRDVLAGEPVQEPTPGGPDTTERVFMYMVALEDNGQIGRVFGCNDSLVPVLIRVDPTLMSMEEAFRQLVGVQTEFYGQTRLYNSLNDSELRLQSAMVVDGVAQVMLEGHVEIAGECDLPRFRTQLEQTALQFDDVSAVEITINGEPLETITGGAQGGGLEPQDAASQVLVYLVAPDSDGGFGCEDSLVAVTREIDTPGTPLQAALTELFTLDPADYEALGLYNVFAQSNLTVEGATVRDGTATIALAGDLILGGVCDNPRVEAQIEATATQFDTVDHVEVTVNGEPLEDVLSLR